MILRLFSLVTLTFALALLPACGGDDHKDHNGHSQKDHDHDDHGHVQTAPRGGTIVDLGDHAANVELVLDGDRKVFALYVLDAHAENAVKIAQPEVEVEILTVKDSTKPQYLSGFILKLVAVTNENTGDTVGNTSQFAVDWRPMIGMATFDGIIKSITVKGATYTDVKFDFKPTRRKAQKRGHS